MSVTHRKDGRWMVTYKINGKTCWDYFPDGIRGERDARDRDQELKNAGVIGEYNRQPGHLSSPLFQALVTEYLSAKIIEMPETSFQNLKYKLIGIILPELGDIQAMQVNPHRLRNYAKKRLKTPVTTRIGKKGNQKKIPVKNNDGSIRTISKTTVHRELSDIIAILNFAVNEGFLPRNPAAKFQKPTRDDEIILPPTTAEVQMIMKFAPPHLFRALTISFYTGLRPGAAELFRITWGDINLPDGNIFILSAKKGGPKSRLVPLHPDFKKSLLEWQIEDQAESVRHLIRWKNQPIKSVDSSFATAKKNAGITRRLRMYDFRHAFASTMLKHGGDLKSTSEMLGHSRTDTTSRIYQHTDLELHRQNINKIPGLIPAEDGDKTPT